ncbi:hypothetical protein HMPREF9466_00209 [Fusobacterium necrophorum subsp. funduliforme 1_1_36S]|nr:hypothetical protein HMPREF9466_00209 [Fusobacterium necrophorum subsp. funduliforme 1_1_36S]
MQTLGGNNRKIFPLFSLLSIKYIEDFTQHFFNIFQYLCFVGKNLFQEKIPIIPSQHYTMDGIDVDLDGKTSLSHLFGGRSCLYGSAWKKWIGKLFSFGEYHFWKKSS